MCWFSMPGRSTSALSSQFWGCGHSKVVKSLYNLPSLLLLGSFSMLGELGEPGEVNWGELRAPSRVPGGQGFVEHLPGHLWLLQVLTGVSGGSCQLLAKMKKGFFCCTTAS